MPSNPNLTTSPSLKPDIPRLVSIIIPAFEHIAFSQLVGNTNTPSGLASCAQQHLAAWKEHAKGSEVPFSIKCTHTDPVSKEETIVATANWAIYPHERAQAEFEKPIYLLRAEWVDDQEVRERAQKWILPAHHRRVRWFGGTPHAELYFMCTDPAWERMGAATACVKWGLERCKESGIPAWLEASEMGKRMYEKLGFVVAGSEEGVGLEGRGVPMVWWPESYPEEKRGPVMPEWKGGVDG